MSSTCDNGNFPKPGSSGMQGKATEKKKVLSIVWLVFILKKDLCGAHPHLSVTRIFPDESGDSEVDNPDVSEVSRESDSNSEAAKLTVVQPLDMQC